MFSDELKSLGKEHSVIHEIYEYGRKRAQEIGKANVYDFSTAVPLTMLSDFARLTMIGLMQMYSKPCYDYVSPAGDYGARASIASNINAKNGTSFSADNLYITSGGLSSLYICIKAIVQPGDEVIVFTPNPPEYEMLVGSAGAKLMHMRTKQDTFQIDFPELWEAINSKTKGVILSSPVNPSGVVYTEDSITALCRIISAKSKEYNHPIYIISDDTYRDLIYDDTNVPYVPKYYANTLVCYSYGIMMAIPGESIGYVLVSDKMQFCKETYMAVCGAAKTIGQVGVSPLLQQVAAKCTGEVGEMLFYKRNRDMLCEGLERLGYNCLKPDGGYYLLMKSPEPEANVFCEKAKEHELLLVPGDIFGCPGYVRLCYAIDSQLILYALRAFEDLAKEYRL